MASIQSFTGLKAWQEAHKLVILVYQETKTFPKEEVFGLVSQMRRASISVTSNIAEGFGRKSYKEKTQFFYLAQGSLMELKNQPIASRDIGYLKEESFARLMSQAELAHKILQGLITSSKNILKSEA